MAAELCDLILGKFDEIRNIEGKRCSFSENSRSIQSLLIDLQFRSSDRLSAILQASLSSCDASLNPSFVAARPISARRRARDRRSEQKDGIKLLKQSSLHARRTGRAHLA